MKLPNSEFIIKSKQHNLITLRLVSDPLLKIGRKKKKVKLLWKTQTEEKKPKITGELLSVNSAEPKEDGRMRRTHFYKPADQ